MISHGEDFPVLPFFDPRHFPAMKNKLAAAFQSAPTGGI
jgi:hypothetical protein